MLTENNYLLILKSLTMIRFVNIESLTTGRMVWESIEASIGAFSIKSIYNTFYLFELSETERECFSDIPMGLDEVMFRYETATTKIGGMKPLIKINMLSGKIFFLEYGRSCDDGIVFCKRGLKPLWLSMDDSLKP